VKPWRPLLTAASLAALAACTTVGPNYKVPQAAAVKAPAAQGAFVGGGSPAVSQAEPPAGWWRLYQDPVLDRLEQQALAANTDLRVAAANLARAEAAASEAKAANEPRLAFSGTVQRALPSAEQYLQFTPAPVATLGDIGASLSYEIDYIGRIRRAVEAAQADAEATQAGLDLARVNVAAEVAAAYVEACSAGEDLEVANHSIELATRSLAVTERLTAAGRTSAIDVTRARAQLNQVRATAPALIATRQAALFRLAVLTGRPPAEFPREVAECVKPPTLTQPIPVGDGAALLRRRPDVRQAERTLAGSTARIGVATAALYPSISLGLNGGTTGIIGDLFGPATNRWAFGPLISWTFPSGGERARIREANAAADAALAHFDGVVLNALRETETSLSAYAQDLQRNAELRSARDEAATSAAQARRLYQAGRSPYLVGLDAERTLATAEAQLAASNGQVAADQVKLFLALGGGWQNAPPVQQVSRR
jgi:NodT family efflux transporter outer membrane factor (OMF) lipoprotein